MRITEHPILDIRPDRKRVTINVDGKEIPAFEGETVAAALYASGIKVHRTSSKFEEPRGVFCNRGRCTDCIMNVDGVPNVRTCVTQVRDGMIVKSLHGLGKWEKRNA
jgi:predicted molibdopterin-dependent oxidoreductase YjgC